MKETDLDGMCPYADKHPILRDINSIALDIYYQAQGTAETISAKRKDFKYVKPSEVESLMNLYQISKNDRPNMLVKIYRLQDIDNRCRPNRPRKR